LTGRLFIPEVAGAMPPGAEGGAVDAGRFRRVSDSDLSPL